jgi:SAM-dependent methyltransferase
MVGDAIRESLDTHAGAQHFCELVEREGRLGDRPRVLAAGCGPGHEARYIARRLPSDVVGVDFGYGWDAALTDGSTPGLRLVEGSVLDLPFEDGGFDGIFYHHVIEHVPDAEASLAELSRVLRRDGLIYVGTPNRHRVLGYLGSYGASAMDKVRWNLADYRARLRGRFRNELGAHAGFSAGELVRLMGRYFRDVRPLTGDYLRFKYGRRLPPPVMSAICARPVLEVVAPSVYATARG